MSDVDVAREHLEHAHHAAEHPADDFARNVSLLIGALAASLALSEMAERSYQNEYLTEHISISDDWGFFGFRNTRARMGEMTSAILHALPSADQPETQAQIKRADDYTRAQVEGTGGDNLASIQARIRARTEARNVALHRYELFEYVNGALQIALVLASVSIVTKLRALAWVAGGFGALAAAAGLLARAGGI